MSEEPKPNDPLRDEFRRLGESLAAVVKTAWERPERKAFQQEIQNGIEELSRSLRQAGDDIRASEVGQKVKTGVDQFRTQVENGKIEETVRKDVQSALQAVNTELQKLVQSLNSKSEPAAAPEAPAEDPPAADAETKES